MFPLVVSRFPRTRRRQTGICGRWNAVYTEVRKRNVPNTPHLDLEARLPRFCLTSNPGPYPRPWRPVSSSVCCMLCCCLWWFGWPPPSTYSYSRYAVSLWDRLTRGGCALL